MINNFSLANSFFFLADYSKRKWRSLVSTENELNMETGMFRQHVLINRVKEMVSACRYDNREK